MRSKIISVRASSRPIKSWMMLAVFLVAVGLMTGCSKVPAGNVGVKYYLLGTSKGVDTEILKPGRYWIGVNEELYLFPTFTQNYTWTKEPVNGDATDESITFQDKDGLTVNADVGISYSVVPDKVPLLFQKYRKGIDEITDTYLRNMVRDALVKAASTKSIEHLYGVGKADLLKEVEDSVRRQVDPLGINVEKLYWTGNLRLPKAITDSINLKLQAVQKTQQRQNEVAQAKAEAEVRIEQARGVAEATLLRAKAEADSIRIKGEALAENPRLVELSAIEKWDGKLPYYNGGPVPFVNVK